MRIEDNLPLVRDRSRTTVVSSLDHSRYACLYTLRVTFLNEYNVISYDNHLTTMAYS